jgi:hypothetical protein
VLSVGDLETMLASGDVQVNTGSGKLARQVEDIVIAAGFNWASANSLTLDAHNSITFDKPVTDNGPAAVTLRTNDGGRGGVLYFGAKGSLSFTSTTNSLTINGATFTLENSIRTLASAMTTNPSGHFALSENYDADQDGVYSQIPIDVGFTGALQGLGNAISHLSINSLGKGGGLALIGSLNHNGVGTVSGLVLRALSIRCPGFRGCSAGGITTDAGVLFNDTVSGTFEGENASFGGLAWENFGSIISSNGHVTIREHGARYSSDAGIIGGLVAESGGTIECSYSTGSVSGAKHVGGLAGDNDGTIDQSFSTAVVKGSDEALVGGLIGYDIDGVLVSNSYATGAVSGGTGAYVGGFLGNDDESSVEYSYSTGAPTGGAGSMVGGFSGDAGNFGDSYWDTTTSGMNQGTGQGNDTGLTGLTTAQFQAALPTGFDPAIWAQRPKINGGLPYLIANPPP